MDGWVSQVPSHVPLLTTVHSSETLHMVLFMCRTSTIIWAGLYSSSYYPCTRHLQISQISMMKTSTSHLLLYITFVFPILLSIFLLHCCNHRLAFSLSSCLVLPRRCPSTTCHPDSTKLVPTMVLFRHHVLGCALVRQCSLNHRRDHCLPLPCRLNISLASGAKFASITDVVTTANFPKHACRCPGLDLEPLESLEPLEPLEHACRRSGFDTNNYTRNCTLKTCLPVSRP